MVFWQAVLRLEDGWMKVGLINCATAQGDIRMLMSEKSHTSDQISAGVSAIVPIGLIAHARLKVLSSQLTLAEEKERSL